METPSPEPQSTPEPHTLPVIRLSALLAERGLQALPEVVAEAEASPLELAELFWYGYLPPVSPKTKAVDCERDGARLPPPFTDLALRVALTGLDGFTLPFGATLSGCHYSFSDSWLSGLCSQALHLHFSDPHALQLVEWVAKQPGGLAAICEGLPPTTKFEVETVEGRLEATLVRLAATGVRLPPESQASALLAIERNCKGWGFSSSEADDIRAKVKASLFADSA